MGCHAYIHTYVRFELLIDIDMIIFIERGIRGDLSQRSVQANNKYMRSFDPSKLSSYYDVLICTDVSTFAICRMGISVGRRCCELWCAPDSSTDYILEIDLEYPQHLWRNVSWHFCPTRDKSPSKRENKLLATLYDKQRYIIHYRNLQQCQSSRNKDPPSATIRSISWLRDYIEPNTQFR